MTAYETLLKLLIDLKGAQLVLSLVIWGAIAFLAIRNQPIPDILVIVGTAVITFWFGVTAGLRQSSGSNVK